VTRVADGLAVLGLLVVLLAMTMQLAGLNDARPRVTVVSQTPTTVSAGQVTDGT
jgi:hypothetical protein